MRLFFKEQTLRSYVPIPTWYLFLFLRKKLVMLEIHVIKSSLATDRTSLEQKQNKTNKNIRKLESGVFNDLNNRFPCLE